MGEIDIWFSARLLIDCHGDAARIEAALRSADFELDGDHEAAEAWASIHQVIIALTEGPRQRTAWH
jgi:hypothetical protein